MFHGWASLNPGLSTVVVSGRPGFSPSERHATPGASADDNQHRYPQGGVVYLLGWFGLGLGGLCALGLVGTIVSGLRQDVRRHRQRQQEKRMYELLAERQRSYYDPVREQLRRRLQEDAEVAQLDRLWHLPAFDPRHPA